MEITIIEKKKNLLVFDIDGATHELCLGLKEELNTDDNVVAATYRVDHPLMRKARFYVETKSKDAETATQEAIKRLQKLNTKLQKLVEKL